MILVDECCTTGFAEYLKSEGLEEIIDVQGCEELRGLRDEHLKSFVRDYDGVLVTKDLRFYVQYDGKKVWYDEDNWEGTYEKINEFEINNFKY